MKFFGCSFRPSIHHVTVVMAIILPAIPSAKAATNHKVRAEMEHVQTCSQPSSFTSAYTHQKDIANQYIQKALEIVNKEEHPSTVQLFEIANTYRQVGKINAAQKLRSQILDIELNSASYHSETRADLIQNYRNIPSNEITNEEFQGLLQLIEQQKAFFLKADLFELATHLGSCHSEPDIAHRRLSQLMQYALTLKGSTQLKDLSEIPYRQEMFSHLAVSYSHRSREKLSQQGLKQLLSIYTQYPDWINLHDIAMAYSKVEDLSVAWSGLQLLLKVATVEKDLFLLGSLAEAYNFLDDKQLAHQGLQQILVTLDNISTLGEFDERSRVYKNIAAASSHLSVDNSVFPQILTSISQSPNQQMTLHSLLQVAAIYTQHKQQRPAMEALNHAKKLYQLDLGARSEKIVSTFELHNKLLWHKSLFMLYAQMGNKKNAYEQMEKHYQLLEQYAKKKYDAIQEQRSLERLHSRITKYSKDNSQGQNLNDQEFQDFLETHLVFAKSSLTPEAKLNWLTEQAQDYEAIDAPQLVHRSLIQLWQLTEDWQNLGDVNPARQNIIRTYGKLSDPEISRVSLVKIESKLQLLNIKETPAEIWLELANAYINIEEYQLAKSSLQQFEFRLSPLGSGEENPKRWLQLPKAYVAIGEERTAHNLIKQILPHIKENNAVWEPLNLNYHKLTSIYDDFNNSQLALKGLKRVINQALVSYPSLIIETTRQIMEWDDTPSVHGGLQYLLSQVNRFKALPSKEGDDLHKSELLGGVAKAYSKLEDISLAEQGLQQIWKLAQNYNYCSYQAMSLYEIIEATSALGNVELTEQYLNSARKQVSGKENCQNYDVTIATYLNLAKAVAQE